MRIADLPWYDLPELQPATDAWWLGIGRHLRALGQDDVPAALQRHTDHAENWRSPHLLLSQACGYDVLYDSADDLLPIATPCYALPGCLGPRYTSVVVVREHSEFVAIADLRGARCSINEASSHSGTNALRPLVAPLSRDGRFFASVTATGSHTDSLLMVQCGEADVACIDAIVFELVRAERPRALDGLRTIGRSSPALAPPYVTSRHTDAATVTRLQEALRRALADPTLVACRAALRLHGFEFLPAAAYAELAEFEAPALRAGYFELPAPRRSPLGVAAPPAPPSARSTCGGERPDPRRPR